MAIGRRKVLVGVLSGAAGLTGLGRAARAFASEAQGLSLYHLHTAETLRVVYREHGDLVTGALDEINYFLRDFRNDKLHSIDVALLDELAALAIDDSQRLGGVQMVERQALRFGRERTGCAAEAREARGSAQSA